MFNTFPTQKREQEQKTRRRRIRNVQHKNLLYLKYWHNFLHRPPSQGSRWYQYIALLVTVSSYQASAGLGKGIPFVSYTHTHTNMNTGTDTNTCRDEHKTHLLMSVLKDRCQPWKQILNRWCHFCHTNDIHNCFQCSQNATQNFWVLLTQIFI